MGELTDRPVTVSVVSHGQAELIADLLEDLVRFEEVSKIIVTQNIPERDIVGPRQLMRRMEFIRNHLPKGFAANHNQAFLKCDTPFFAVLNPDLRLPKNPFPSLLGLLSFPDCGLSVPRVLRPDGMIDDSVRYFPTAGRLVSKLLRLSDGCYPVNGDDPLAVDWAAGMFMLFRADVFREIGGFDEGFFLYYEDVDICARLWKAGLKVMLHPGESVIHAARRASRKKPRYMAWHISSMARYFAKHLGRLPLTRYKF